MGNNKEGSLIRLLRADEIAYVKNEKITIETLTKDLLEGF